MLPTAVTSDFAAPAGGDDRRWWALAVVSTTQTMIALDLTIMLIALPSAERDLPMTIQQGRWVLTGYTLAFGALLMLAGRVADMVGRRRALIIGGTGFAAASALGGAAVDPAMLLAARALQGGFAALLAPSTLALISVTFPNRIERGRAFGIFGATIMGGIAVGLLLGGLLTQLLSWRWCMYINVPIAVGCVIATRRFVLAAPAISGLGIDLPGAVLVATGVGALVFAISDAETHGWGSTPVLGLIVAATVLLALFAFWESRASQPLLPLRVLRDGSRVGANIAFLAANIANNGAFLLLTYQAQSILGYSALLSGIAFLPLILVIAPISTRVTPPLMSRYPPRPLITAGLLVMAVAMLAMTRLTADGSYLQLLAPLVLIGLGMGLSSAPASSASTQVEDPADASAASALVRSSQQIGAALGTSIVTTLAARYAATAPSGDTLAAATVHGFTSASYWAAGVVFTAAIIVWWLMSQPARSSEQSSN
jgi:EmrB/QacA subfamily drug resistance transporter